MATNTVANIRAKNPTPLGVGVCQKDGCYQPLPASQTKNLQKQVKHVLRQGTSHVKRSGRQVTQRGKNIATQLGKRLKKQDIQGTPH